MDGSIVRSVYNVAFPGMHDEYRKYFNAVDLFNRSCFGNHSVQFAVKTRSWSRRLFLAILGMCETNAFNAYKYVKGDLTRYEWLVRLSHALLNNPWVEAPAREPRAAPVVPSATPCGNQVYTLHRVNCATCGKKSQWKCGCGKHFCRSGTSDGNPLLPCYFNHLVETLGGGAAFPARGGGDGDA